MAAANKYDMPVLFQKCQVELSSKVTAKNAAECYLMAYLHDATFLERCAMKVVITEYEEVKKSDGFSKVIEHPKALLKILDNLLILK